MTRYEYAERELASLEDAESRFRGFMASALITLGPILDDKMIQRLRGSIEDALEDALYDEYERRLSELERATPTETPRSPVVL